MPQLEIAESSGMHACKHGVEAAGTLKLAWIKGVERASTARERDGGRGTHVCFSVDTGEASLQAPRSVAGVLKR